MFAAVGEPPMGLGYGVVLALRQAITAARTLAGNTDWFAISKPIRPFITGDKLYILSKALLIILNINCTYK